MDQILAKIDILMNIECFIEASYSLLKPDLIISSCRVSKGLSNRIEFKVVRCFHSTTEVKRCSQIICTSEHYHLENKIKFLSYSSISFDREEKELSFGI